MTMISMPVIFREFRVAARQKRTFVFRTVFGALLAFMALMFMLTTAFSRSWSGMGYYLLKTLSWQMFALLFVFAPAVTCGCISDEKRQGTLGLLLLTHLNSADIVLGKFFSRAIDLILLFLSATPFLFVPVLMGGVNWDVIFSAVLCILSMLVLALAFGVYASAYSRTTAQAVIVAYVGLILYNVVLIFVTHAASLLTGTTGKLAIIVPLAALKMGSPAAAMFYGGTHNALVSLAWSGGVAVALIAMAIWKLPRTLHAETFREPFWRSVRGLFSPSVRTIRKRASGRSTLDRNPLLWLSYSRYGNWLFQLVVVTIICVVLAWIYTSFSGHIARTAFSFSMKTGGWLFGFAVRILILVSVARSFSTEKEDGSLELLLTTPVTNRQVVHARIASVLLRFGLLYALACVLQLTGGVFQLGLRESGMWVFEIVSDVTGLFYLITIGLLISVWSKSVTQSIMLTIFATILLGWLLTMVGYMIVALAMAFLFSKLGVSGSSTGSMWFLGFGFMGVRAIIELGLAIGAYWLLVKNFRRYATR